MKILSIDVDWIQSGLHVEQLNKVFFNAVKDVKKIVFADHHHLITTELQDYNNIILHNIDHHHDIVYNDEQVVNIKENEIKSPHWVGNLLYQGRLKQYYWYKNVNSQFIRDGFFGEQLLLENECLFNYYENLNELDNIPFDMMFLCKSPFYTPGEFQLVYNIYTDYIKYHHSDKLKEVITRTNVHNY